MAEGRRRSDTISEVCNLVAGGELGGVVERVDGARVGQVVVQLRQTTEAKSQHADAGTKGTQVVLMMYKLDMKLAEQCQSAGKLGRGRGQVG